MDPCAARFRFRGVSKDRIAVSIIIIGDQSRPNDKVYGISVVEKQICVRTVVIQAELLAVENERFYAF